MNIPFTSKCPSVYFTRWKPGSPIKMLLPLSAETRFLPLSSVVWRRLPDAFLAPHCSFQAAFLLIINSSFESEVIKPSNNLLLSPCCCHCPWFLKHLSAWFTVTDSNVVYHYSQCFHYSSGQSSHFLDSLSFLCFNDLVLRFTSAIGSLVISSPSLWLINISCL